MTLSPQDTTALLDHVHIWLPFCMIELQIELQIVYRQWFLEVFLSPFSNVNDRIMPMSDAVSSEGPNHIHIWLPFCMIELYLASADGTADCVYRQWFLEVFLGPFSNVNDRIDE